MGRTALFALPIASALLAVVTFPSFNLSPLAWLALAPFLFALRRTGLRGAAGLGFLFGWLFTAGVFSWLPRLTAMTSWRGVIMDTGAAVYFLGFWLLYNLMRSVAGGWLLLRAPALRG